MIKNINVRFFTWCNNEDEISGIDCAEITESQFLKLTQGFEKDNVIYYERNTMFENGCNQICLTVEPLDYPDFYDLERV